MNYVYTVHKLFVGKILNFSHIDNTTLSLNDSDAQHSSQELRLISTPRLHPLLDFHLVPINQIIFLET